MSDEVHLLVADCVLGTASADERATVSAIPSARALVHELEGTLEQVGLVLAPPRRPWQRITSALEGAKRLAHLAPVLADHFAVTVAAAVELLDRVDVVEAWLEGPGPGVWLMPVVAGAKWEGFITTLLKLEPNAQFPLHQHGSEERVLLLEGGYRDDQGGLEFWRGELDVRALGTVHSFTALPELGCVCASVTKLPED